jgi:hypothetical protein
MEREADDSRRREWAKTALKADEIEALRRRLQQEGKI